MRALWALGALVVLCTSCKKEQPIKAAPYTFELTVTGFDLPEQGAEIVYEDTSLGRVKPKAPTVRVTLPDDVYLVEAKGRLRVRVDGTCGKQDVPLRIPFSDKQQEARALRADVQSATFETENVTVARIYYDNQGAPATAFSIGSFNVDVAAGERGVANVVLGSCSTARQVFVAGARVGELPTQPVMSQGPIAALFDLHGGRCYRRRLHVYIDGVQQKPEPLKPPPPPPKPTTIAAKNAKAAPVAAAPSASSSGAPPALPIDTLLKGQRVYPVDVIHDFLDWSPERLFVRPDQHTVQRVELLHCEDKNKPPAETTKADTKPTTSASSAPAAPPAPAKKPAPSVATAAGSNKKRK